MCDRLGRMRSLCTLACLAALVATTGCTYLSNRGADALDMFDVGVTWTTKPQFGVYANCPFLAPIGYSKVDGHYAGIGGGQAGVMKHTQDNVGLLAWGREDVSWESKNKNAPKGVGKRTVAAGGFLTEALVKDNPYDPTCAHYLHLGYVGVTGNMRYAQIGDFFLGWAGLDLAGDDNRWQGGDGDEETAATVVAARPEAEPAPREPVARPKPAPAPEPTVTVAAAAKPAPRPKSRAAAGTSRPKARPRTEFCLRCGGRRYVDRWPPVPSDTSASSSLSAAEKEWAGRWCDCWRDDPKHVAATGSVGRESRIAGRK